MTDKKKLNELKKDSKQLQPILRIGKNGLSENTIKQIELLLKKRKLIKIKILSNCLDNSNKEEIINEVVEKCNCVLVDKIGLTFSLFKGNL